MGRTNLIILGFGILACVALSLMMGQVVTIKEKKEVHPAMFELQNVFGEQIEHRPRLEVVARGRKRVAVLTITPKAAQHPERLARAMGRYLARFRGADLQFDALEVDTRGKDGTDITYPIRVSGGRRSLDRRIAPQRRPARRSRAPSTPARKPASPPEK